MTPPDFITLGFLRYAHQCLVKIYRLGELDSHDRRELKDQIARLERLITHFEPGGKYLRVRAMRTLQEKEAEAMTRSKTYKPRRTTR